MKVAELEALAKNYPDIFWASFDGFEGAWHEFKDGSRIAYQTVIFKSSWEQDSISESFIKVLVEFVEYINQIQKDIPHYEALYWRKYPEFTINNDEHTVKLVCRFGFRKYTLPEVKDAA